MIAVWRIDLLKRAHTLARALAGRVHLIRGCHWHAGAVSTRPLLLNAPMKRASSLICRDWFGASGGESHWRQRQPTMGLQTGL